MPDFIDIHSHPSFPAYDHDREEMLGRLTQNNIWAIGIGVDLESSKKEVALAESREGIFACIGLHPNDNKEETFDEKEFEKLVTSSKVVGVGECGLDYARMEGGEEEIIVEKKRQKDIFIKQIEFALKYDKTLMLHCRDSYGDVLDILEGYKKEHGDKLRGNTHFFAGSVAEAERFVKIGFTLSFTGVITFAGSYDEVIKNTPIEMIMSETDAPFVAPVPYRGKRNESAYVLEVVKRVAEIKGIALEESKKALVSNAFRLFKLK